MKITKKRYLCRMNRLVAVVGIYLAVIILAMPFSAVGQDEKVDREVEIATIEKAIHGVIGWAKTKDFKLLYSIIADDPGYLEIDPTAGVIRGISDFKKNESFWSSPDFKAVRYEIRDLKIDLSQSGTVAWYYCELDDVNEWKGQPANWMNTRWTGVLEKREGKWVIVQMHFSFAR